MLVVEQPAERLPKDLADAIEGVGTRLHAGIIAVTQNTPSILIAYQNKIRGLRTFISNGISIVDVEGLDLVKEFEAFRHCTSEDRDYIPSEVESVRSIITEFNRMYVDYYAAAI